MTEAAPLCPACRYPDCLIDAARLDCDFARSEGEADGQEKPYDESTIVSARGLYQACYKYRQSVDIATDLLGETTLPPK